jgi:hypothetical protein
MALAVWRSGVWERASDPRGVGRRSRARGEPERVRSRHAPRNELGRHGMMLARELPTRMVLRLLMEPADRWRSVPWKPILLSACVAAGGLYWMFLWPDVDEDNTKPPIALIAGWDEIGACASMASLDGTREIRLSHQTPTPKSADQL